MSARTPSPARGEPSPAALQSGWVIANHILVAFHVAFISSVLALPSGALERGEVMAFIFLSPETIVSAAFTYLTFHAAIALHEMGHFLEAARQNALNAAAQAEADRRLAAGALTRALYRVRLFALAPFGLARGIRRQGLSYYPDAPYNLAVAAAGPRVSGQAALATLIPAAALLAWGIAGAVIEAVYVGRLLLGIGAVCGLDFLYADAGKYAEFRRRERAARDKAARVGPLAAWRMEAPGAKTALAAGRLQRATHPTLGPVCAPWQFRNCGMGGRHTEKEYPESNLSMQEAMFLIRSAPDYGEAQEMTVRLQTRLKEIIEQAEGCRVMGIGLEGGLAPYIDRGDYPLPEVRLWAMMTQAITDCGYRPGADVAIALDPAMSELEIAYRRQFDLPGSVGQYLFWRDREQRVLDREQVLEIFAKAIDVYEIPLLSIEDGFSEDDAEGWHRLLEREGDSLFVVGDDLVTTNDAVIERDAGRGLLNCALIKANQIGTLSETLLAMLVARGRGLELIISHRSKSPNDDMEAHLALASNALGLKAGGGANTERLLKYQAVADAIGRIVDRRAMTPDTSTHRPAVTGAIIRHIRAREEPTNAGIPTVAAEVEVELPGSGVRLRFSGATPLGTSAGTGEAIHLVDATIEAAEHREIAERWPNLFVQVEPRVLGFAPGVDDTTIAQHRDDDLADLWRRAQRYGGKGCRQAVDNVNRIIAPHFVGRNLAELDLLEIDRELLQLEQQTAHRRDKLDPAADAPTVIALMQRKQNLGMNAVLAVSLALARARAHIRGVELFELLRETMMDIIRRAAEGEGLPFEGTRFEDYLQSLSAVAARVADDGTPLHVVLRGVTGIYAPLELATTDAPSTEPRPEPAIRAVVKGKRDIQDTGRADDERTAAPTAVATASTIALAPGGPARARQLAAQLAARLGPGFRRDPHHGWNHAERVLDLAIRIAQRSGLAGEVDWEVLGAAACLHDVAAGRRHHAAHAAQRAQAILGEIPGFTPARIDRAAAAIRLHDQRGSAAAAARRLAGPEAQLLYDGDTIEGFGAKGVYRYLAIASARGAGPAALATEVRTRFAELCYPATRDLAAGEYEYALGFAEGLDPDEPLTGGPPFTASGVAAFVATHRELPPTRLAEAGLRALAGTEEARGRVGREFFRRLREAFPRTSTSTTTPLPDARQTPGASLPGELHLEPDEREALAELDRAFHASYVTGRQPRAVTIARYVRTKNTIAARRRTFGVVNNRLLRAGDSLVIPYISEHTVVLRGVGIDGEPTAPLGTHRFPPGTIFTDDRLAALIGERLDPGPEPWSAIELEHDLSDFDIDKVQEPALERLRDVVALLQRVNEGTNRSEAVYLLRRLTARLCNAPVRGFLGAKNLQPELVALTEEMVRFLGGPLGRRLPLLRRLVVRNLSLLLGRPQLIDRLWSEAITLAEVQVPGSAIVNELRRSCHHALGRRTLRVAQAYLAYLETADDALLTELGFARPGAADAAARERPEVAERLRGMVTDLEQLTGTGAVMTRIRDWQAEYADRLLRCAYGRTLPDQAAQVIERGIDDDNRWAFTHHLGLLVGKLDELGGEWTPFRVAFAELAQSGPGSPDFDAEGCAARVRQVTADLTTEIQATHQVALFDALDEIADFERGGAFREAFEAACHLRHRVAERFDNPSFSGQRFYLLQLDCLLEEVGYLALRQIASRYEEEGVDVGECVALIRQCARNLRHDGLYSRELEDLSEMLVRPGRSSEQLLDILDAIERTYHKVRSRVTRPFETMEHHRGVDEAELQAVLANMRRYLHDLSSLAQFSDMASEAIRHGSAKRHLIPIAPAAEDAAEPAVMHLSHRDMIARAFEAGQSAINLRELYGGKGSGLLYISHRGMPTRDGFIIPTTFPRSVAADKARRDERLAALCDEHLAVLEEDIAHASGAHRRFGDPQAPLLLAVRGGSVFSMPGILGTVLFVGINDAIAAGLAKDGPWHAWDSYRRFLSSFAQLVWGLDIHRAGLVEAIKRRYGVSRKRDLPWQGMKDVAEESKAFIADAGHGDELAALLADPRRQLHLAAGAVIDSWHARTARRFREIKGLCRDWDTAVIIQEMAFGNRQVDRIEVGMDETRASLTGVIPRTQVTPHGHSRFVGEAKFSAAGDDLVGGVLVQGSLHSMEDLRTLMPMLTGRLRHVVAKLRRLMGTDQEVEFTVDRGVLSVLQSRTAETAHDRATDRFRDPGEPIARGLGIRGGGFRGLVALAEEEIATLRRRPELQDGSLDGVVLVLDNPSPDDIPAVLSADALLTAKGGSTSHAAVAIHGIEDRPYCAVMSAVGLEVDPTRRLARLVSASDPAGPASRPAADPDPIAIPIRSGDVISLHGNSGEIFIGRREIDRPAT